MPEPTVVREARPDDVPALVALMAELYAGSGYPLPAAAAARTFAPLLVDPRVGKRGKKVQKEAKSNPCLPIPILQFYAVFCLFF